MVAVGTLLTVGFGTIGLIVLSRAALQPPTSGAEASSATRAAHVYHKLHTIHMVLYMQCFILSFVFTFPPLKMFGMLLICVTVSSTCVIGRHLIHTQGLREQTEHWIGCMGYEITYLMFSFSALAWANYAWTSASGYPGWTADIWETYVPLYAPIHAAFHGLAGLQHGLQVYKSKLRSVCFACASEGLCAYAFLTFAGYFSAEVPEAVAKLVILGIISQGYYFCGAWCVGVQLAIAMGKQVETELENQALHRDRLEILAREKQRLEYERAIAEHKLEQAHLELGQGHRCNRLQASYTGSGLN